VLPWLRCPCASHVSPWSLEIKTPALGSACQ
jgi:hypothetical protein